MDKSAASAEFNPHFQHHGPPMGHEAGPPPPPGFQQPGAPVIVMAPAFGPESCPIYCRTCNKTVNTNVIKKAGGKTHLIAILLCAIGCCVCAPCVYCANTLQTYNHHCPTCNSYLGAYSSI